MDARTLLPRRSALALAVLLATLVGCTPGTAVPPSASPVAAVPSPSAAAPTPSASAAAFPVTLVDDEGTSVEIPAEPESIVSLTPAATETLFELGVGDRVVGKVEDIANVPEEAADVPVVATFQGVDLEKIVDLEPDLVIAGGNGLTPADAITQLRAADLPVLVLYADDLDGVLEGIELTGAAVGASEAATALTDEMRATFEAVAAATAGLDAPRVFYQTGSEPALYGIAEDSFVAAMIEQAGGEPITTGSATSWEMPAERLIEADPEVILMGDAAYGVTAEQVAARPGWDAVTAVREGAIRPIDDIIVTRPGPRLDDGLRALAEAIHPGIDLPEPAGG